MRLIDADALKESIHTNWYDAKKTLIEWIDRQPTAQSERMKFVPGALVSVTDTNRGCIYTTQVDGSGNLRLESQRNVATVKKEMSDIDSCIYDVYYCPKCGKRIGTIKENYCSNCGIKLGY